MISLELGARIPMTHSVCILVAYGVYLGDFIRIHQDTSGYVRIH